MMYYMKQIIRLTWKCKFTLVYYSNMQLKQAMPFLNLVFSLCKNRHKQTLTTKPRCLNTSYHNELQTWQEMLLRLKTAMQENSWIIITITIVIIIIINIIIIIMIRIKMQALVLFLTMMKDKIITSPGFCNLESFC